MKKVLFGMMAAAAMLFTSCSQEEFNFSTAEKANVAINLSTPQIASRAYSDGKSANHLQYAVYDVTDGNPVLIADFTKTNETIDLRKTVNFQLANGRTYNLVFWAASSNADGQYDVKFDTDKADMTVNYGDFFKANCEDLDAFYACQQVKVNGSAVVDVKMYRPFAQINVGTDDYAAAAVAGSKPTMSSVTVDNVFSNLDLMTGAVSGEKSYTFTNNVIAAPYDEATGTGEKFPVDGYDYVAMAYALVDAEQALTTVTFTHTGGSVTEEITVGSVPVQRNYRTNLYGSILTSGIVANVEIVPAYEEPDNNIDLEGAICMRDENNKVVCTQPLLPIGVNPDDFEDNNNAGVVTINDKGEAVYFPKTGKGLADAMNASETGEIYLAPNSTITMGSHDARIPVNGAKIYGNGATITGGEYDFVLQYTPYEAGSEVDIYIENLNNARIWGDATVACTFNVTLKNCTFIGGGYGKSLYGLGLIMMRGTNVATHNITLEDCYCEGVQTGMHSINAGEFTIKNCTFKEVGIPVNLAKKSTDNATVTIEGCKFIKCGLTEELEQDVAVASRAYDYAAPIRVVENGKDNTTTVKISNCTITERYGDYDILFTDFRPDKSPKLLTSYTITETTSDKGELSIGNK